MASNRNPKCSCPMCENIGVHAFPIRRRGGNNGYLCSWHINHLHSYSFENPIWAGTEKAHGFTVSKELETMAPTNLARCELLVEQYFPTSDCTVDVEFKSPIYRGFNAIAAYASTIEYLKNSGNITIDENCGTHTHIGHTFINSVSMAYIRRFYHSLFLDIYKEWANDREKACRLFGRYNASWARYIDSTTDKATRHENAINVQHEPTIEFRQVRFQTAEQYITFLHYAKSFMIPIVDIFIPAIIEAGLARVNGGELVAVGDISEKTEDYEFNLGVRTLTDSQRKILKDAAAKVSKKLVKNWRKLDLSDLHWSGECGGTYNTCWKTF